MRHFIQSLVLIAFLVAPLSQAQALDEKVSLNQNAQILVTGILENTCHKAGPTRATVDVDARVISITQTLYLIDSAWCLQVVMPYPSIVHLGTIPPGAYRIELQSEEISEEGLGI
jgi:hypothetical protein